MNIRRRPPNPAVAVQNLHYQVRVPDAEPRNILEKIVWKKEAEVAKLREKLSLRDLQRDILSAPPARSFIEALRQSKTKPALIAEVKKSLTQQRGDSRRLRPGRHCPSLRRPRSDLPVGINRSNLFSGRL